MTFYSHNELYLVELDYFLMCSWIQSSFYFKKNFLSITPSVTGYYISVLCMSINVIEVWFKKSIGEKIWLQCLYWVQLLPQIQLWAFSLCRLSTLFERGINWTKSKFKKMNTIFGVCKVVQVSGVPWDAFMAWVFESFHPIYSFILFSNAHVFNFSSFCFFLSPV